MALRFKVNQLLRKGRSVSCRLPRNSGNILVYIVMVMVIFSLLGAAMVSLFSTSISSSAIRNDTRRATYLSESGIRYAMSELRAADFSETAITSLNKNFLNNDYKMSPTETFGLNIFGPWFEPSSTYDAGTQLVDVDVLEGRLPEGYLPNLPVGDPDFLLVNFNAFDPLSADAQSPITGFGSGSPTSFQIQLSDDFVAHVNEQVAFAVTPLSDGQDILSQGYLDLKIAAKKLFPELGGAFTVQDKDFYYKRVDPTINDRVRLVDVALIPGQTSGVTVAAQDPVLLTPLRNRLIVSEGRSGEVTFGNNIDYAASIVDHSLLPKSRKPDIAFEEEPDLSRVLGQDKPGSEQPESNPDFITVDNINKLLTIGGYTGPLLGAAWFQDARSIGGVRNFCGSNGCFFRDGIRVFFLVDYTGSGDGFIFSLINGSGTDAVGNPWNDTASVGGDIERSEMLGYSGDSRRDVAGTQFVDNSGLYRGLFPPKIGIEFDTKVNVSSGDNYCSNSTNLRANTRNDPGTPAADNRDAVQFVYWANSTLDVPCRKEPFCQLNPSCTGDPSYDDNRHNTTFPNWKFNTGGAILSAPAIGTDGTVYVGSNSTRFFAVNPDGTEKWRLNLAGPSYSPTLSSTGRIYVGTGAMGNRLLAIRDDSTFGNILWGFPTGGPVTTKPAVGTVGASTGIVYFGSDDGTFRAVNSSGILEWFFTPLGLPAQPFRSSPAISPSGGTVYFGSNNGNFYARNAGTGAIVWTPSVAGAGAYLSSPVVGSDGTVFVGNDNGRIYAFDGPTGAVLWSFDTGAPVRSSPALSSDGSRIYIGSENDILFALNASNGAEAWRFTGASGDIDSGIQVDASGHIYFGSDDDNVYALYPDGTLKWSFTTGGNVEVKPAVKGDGTVYAGSSDGQLYSINQVTTPANLKNLLITSSGQSVGGVPVTITSEADWLKGSSSKGPWAVRLEIARSQVEAAGTYAYNLKAWIRQCSVASCNDPNDPLGTFYEDTRVQYSPDSPTARPPMIEQTVNLTSADHAAFERFIFGFTSQTGAGETQTATIRKFQLSFIRPNDPILTTDPQWP